jgi:bifunctional DNase/RNase
MPDLERSWKVGELARATGLTIRALHHYDEIGLLVPGRTESGHRVYAPADVERLYRVLALRGVGMTLDEIAAVLDDDGVSLIDTVRRHVAAVERDIEQRQRLLARLREMLDGLEHSTAPSVDELIGTVEAMTVVEATIEDVVTREPREEAFETNAPFVVLLRERSGERVLPIWIGEPEARALVMQRRDVKTPRPMSHDLMLGLLGALDARVERVVIERLEQNTFFATVAVASGGDQHEVDARPSDALNLALRSGAPIHVASEIVDTSAVERPAGAWTSHEDGDPAPAWISLSTGTDPPRTRTHTVGERSPAFVRRAADEARRLGHGYVEPAHLVLGILADEDSAAARLLERHGVTLGALREAVAVRPVSSHARPPDERLCLNSHAMFFMGAAALEARRRGEALQVGELHVLVALAKLPGATELPGLGGIDVDALGAAAQAELDA